MRNRNWDQDFEHINQSNVNRFSVNRDGQRQYDSGYHNNMGTTSFDRNMQDRSYQDRNFEGSNLHNPYSAHPERYDYAPSHRHARVDYDERRYLHNRNPEQNATDRGFMGRVGDFLHNGMEQVEHLFDRFGNRQRNEGYDADRGYNQPDYYRNNTERQYRPSGNEGQNRNQHAERYPSRNPRPGFENSPYYQGNQGHVQGNRYQSSDYSGRSSYRLLDSNSGYGQSGGSYASDRDGD